MMEPLEVINQRLLEYYGRFESTDMPNYRVVFSDDQREVRINGQGFQEVPKYSYIKRKYLLEKLILANNPELTTVYSYECIWPFEDRHGNPLPPKWEAIELIINQVHKQMGDKSGVKYVDPEKTAEGQIEEKKKRVEKLIEDLFGNESDIADALHWQQGVPVPSNYNKGS